MKIGQHLVVSFFGTLETGINITYMRNACIFVISVMLTRTGKSPCLYFEIHPAVQKTKQTRATLAKSLHGLRNILPSHSNFVSKMHRFPDMTTYWSKIAEKNLPHPHLARSFGVTLANFSTTHTLPETRIMGLSEGVHFTILLPLC